MNDTQKLLADYVKDGSEAAFRELVTRYINLVHSTAARLVNGDSHLAEDITQTVFANLARKARTLAPNVMLGGWLHRNACFVARTTMRGERRRQFREREAVALNIPDDHTAANLARVAPILDDAINQLEPGDRAAVMLRFFEQLEYRAVGRAIGSSEDAARMKVSRALEKLHTLLRNRGATLSAAGLAAALAAGAVTAAPSGLATSVASAALAGASTGGIVATILKFMTITKLKIAFASALAVAALAVPVVVQHQSLEKLREDNQSLRQQTAQLDALQTENQRLSNLVVEASHRPAAAEAQAREFARLQNTVGMLRERTNELGAELKRTRGAGRGEAEVEVVSEAIGGKRHFHTISMAQFANFIGGVLQAPVADQTGLTGLYDIEITPPRLGGEDGKLERVTGILLNELGMQLTVFAGPFTADEKGFEKPLNSAEEIRYPNAIGAKANRAANPNGSPMSVASGSSNTSEGYALKLDRVDAPGIKPASNEEAAVVPEGSTTFLYDAGTPVLATAVATKLMMLDGAKKQWALDKGKQNTDTPTWQDLAPYLPRGGNYDSDFTKPHDGFYVIGSVGTKAAIRATPAAEAAWTHPEDPAAVCINNLRLIDSAKQQWALEKRKKTTDIPTPDDLSYFLTTNPPVCPKGGTYTYGSIGEYPKCSVPGHSLP